MSFYLSWAVSWIVGGVLGGVVAGVIVAAILVFVTENMINGTLEWVLVLVTFGIAVFCMIGIPVSMMASIMDGPEERGYLDGLVASKRRVRTLVEWSVMGSIVILAYAASLGVTYVIALTTQDRVLQAQKRRAEEVAEEVARATERTEGNIFLAAKLACPSLSDSELIHQKSKAEEFRTGREAVAARQGELTLWYLLREKRAIDSYNAGPLWPPPLEDGVEGGEEDGAAGAGVECVDGID